MSSDYSPDPGDSVKLVGKANPDNVLYGVVNRVYDDYEFHCHVDGLKGANAFEAEDWTITPWTRPVTFKPFAVVRLPEGWDAILHPSDHQTSNPVTLFTRAMDDYWTNYGGVDWELTDADVATLLNHGAEILFEGVDYA